MDNVFGVEEDSFTENAAAAEIQFMWASRLLIADILKIRHEVGHRLRRHDAHIHSLDIVLNCIGFSEIEPAHWAQLLIRRGRNDCNWFFDKTSLVRTWLWAGAKHVNDGMSFDIFAGQTLLGHSLLVIGVYRTV